MATIKDVAHLAEVSTCTVSRVLSNKGYISDKTRAAVLAAVEELNYRPNPIASELKAGVSNSIGLIVPDITNYYYMELAAEIERRANAAGQLIYLCNTGYDKKKEKRFASELTHRMIKGLIVIPASNDIAHFTELKKKIPFTFVNRKFADELDNCIVEDNHHAAYEITTHLLEKGAKRISGIFQSFDNMIYRERFEGMVHALQEAGVPYDKSLSIFDAEIEKIYASIASLFADPNPPDAFFASNDMLAFDVYKVLAQLGKRIPEDVMVVGFDDTVMANKISPSLTSYRMPIDIIAKRSIDAILKKSTSYEEEPITGMLVLRASTRL